MKRKNILCILGLLLLLSGCARQQGQTTQQQSQQPQQQPASDSISAGNSNGNSNSNTGTNAATQTITVEEAKAKALAHAGLASEQVTFIKSQLDYENGRQVYELEFYTQDYKEYDYEIDAYTGEVVGFDYDAEYQVPSASADAGGAITEEKAKELALAKVPGATANDIRKFEMDYDDGRKEYEGEIIYNGMEYEFEIDASNGVFLKWEEEPVGH